MKKLILSLLLVLSPTLASGITDKIHTKLASPAYIHPRFKPFVLSGHKKEKKKEKRERTQRSSRFRLCLIPQHPQPDEPSL